MTLAVVPLFLAQFYVKNDLRSNVICLRKWRGHKFSKFLQPLISARPGKGINYGVFYFKYLNEQHISR